uniref:Uncharacterized protein n=1 Tax=Biomphalaria glabrata TaxID=6526 RepID=A0A2C9LXS9_BIOGL
MNTFSQYLSKKMKETIFLVLSILVCKVYSDGGVSFYVGSYTIQFNETMLQSLLKCLCETTFGCDVYFKYSHNLLTPYRVIKYSSSFNNGSFYDAYVCNEPMTVTLPSFSCTKVIVNSPILPITSEDSCITLKYENYTGCFSNGMALFWSYNPFEMNITSPSIKKNNNCEEVVTVSTSTMSSTLLTQATSTSQSLPESSYFLTTTSNPSLANVVSTTGSETLLTTAAYSASATTPDTSAGTLAPPNIDTATQLTALQTNAQMETMSSSLAFASLDPNSISASMLSLFTLTTEPVLSDTSEPLHSSMFQSLTVSLLTTTELTTAALHISSLTSAPDFSFASTSGQPMTTDAAATNSVPLDASMSVVIDVVSVSSVLGVSNAIGVSSTSGLVTSATVEATSGLSTGSWPTISGMISGSAVVTMTVSLSDIAPTLSSSYTSLGFVSLSSAPGTKTLDTLTQSGSTRTDTLSNSAITSTGTIDASATASLDTSLLITPSMTDLTYTGVVASTINPSPSQPTTSDSNYGSGGHSSGVTLHPTASSSLSTSSPPPANVTIPPPGLNSRQEDDRDKIIAITVGVIGGALFIFAIIIAIFCWRRRQKDRSYETMDAQSTSSDQRSDTSEEIPSKTPDAVNFDGIIPRFPNYKDYNGWDTFRPPYFTMIDIGPTAHNIIKGSVVSPGDATLTKKSSFKKKSSMKSVQFVNPLVEEIEPDYDATVSISSNGQPKKGIIVKTVKFKNTVSESNDFEDVPREDTDKEQSYEYPHQTSSDYDYATVSFSSENRDSHGTYDTLGTVSDSPSKTSGPPLTSFQSNTPNGHMPNNTVEESTHF